MAGGIGGGGENCRVKFSFFPFLLRVSRVAFLPRALLVLKKRAAARIISLPVEVALIRVIRREASALLCEIARFLAARVSSPHIPTRIPLRGLIAA